MVVLHPRHLLVAILSITLFLSTSNTGVARSSSTKWSHKNPHPGPDVEFYLAKIQRQRAVDVLIGLNIAAGISGLAAELDHMRRHHRSHGILCPDFPDRLTGVV